MSTDPKSLAAEIEAVLAGRDDERVARILCDVWGYQWDGDPDADENVIPERAGGDYDRPDKKTFIAGAVAIRSQVIAPLIAALQSRAFEDGERSMRQRAEDVARAWMMPEPSAAARIMASANLIARVQARNETVAGIATGIASLRPEGERNA